MRNRAMMGRGRPRTMCGSKKVIFSLRFVFVDINRSLNASNLTMENEDVIKV